MVNDNTLLEKIIASTGEVKFRLVGDQYYKDYAVNKKQLAVFKETMQLFDSLSNK
jgi:hypothetical protein